MSYVRLVTVSASFVIEQMVRRLEEESDNGYEKNSTKYNDNCAIE